ncbi:MAG: chorismate-binding protein [Flammeovirgaceae bacterium]
MDSGVMIRFIEKTPRGLIYRSGGGITAMSNAEQEYDEAIHKVYAPVY